MNFDTIFNTGLRTIMDRCQIYPHVSSHIINNVSRHIDDIKNIDDALNFVYSFEFLGVDFGPLQHKYEIERLLRVVDEIKPSIIIEIGTSRGGTLFLFTIVAESDANIISIDMPGGPFGGGYPKWKIPLYESLARENQKIHLIRNDSHNPVVLDGIKGVLGDNEVDFLFLDGDHSYEGVKRDFEMYSPLVRRGGIVALHDIVEHPVETRCDVSKFWREVKSNYEHTEIVKDWQQRWAGIGVLFL